VGNAVFKTPVRKTSSLIVKLWAVSWEMCALGVLRANVQERITFQENAHKGAMGGGPVMR